MRNFIKYFPILVLIISCGRNKGPKIYQKMSESKSRSTKIVLPNLAVSINAKIRVLSSDTVLLEAVYKNLTNDTIYLPEIYFPNRGVLSRELFVINKLIDGNPGDRLPFTGLKKTSLNSVINFLPYSELTTSVNLSNYYDFNYKKRGIKNDYILTVDFLVPYIDANSKIRMVRDSVDSQLKEAFIIVDFPQHKDIDSMRIHFTIPNS